MASFTKTTAAGLLTVFLFCLVGSEFFCHWPAGNGFWYRHWDFTGDLTSLPEVEDRLASVSKNPRRIYLLGDSILGPTALKEHRIPFPRDHSLSISLQKDAAPESRTILSLGADGLLLPDLEALGHEIEKYPPEQVLLVLNMRMFTREFEEGPKAISRTFLMADLPPEVAAQFKPVKAPETGEKVETWADLHWVLFRTCKLLKTLWYYPSQKDFFQSLLEKLLNKEEDEDLKQAALKF